MIRLLIATAVGLIVSWVGTRFLIGWLNRRSMSQPIQEDGVASHHETKTGTPTLGLSLIHI